VKLAFVGDLGLTSSLLPDPLSRVAPEITAVLGSCDLAVANLELPVRPSDAPVAPYSHPSLRGRPEAWPLLRKAGFGAVCMASNHCMDSGRKGIAFTRYLADRDGLAVFGAGLDEGEARSPAIVDTRGSRIALLGYCKKGPFTASGARAGAALLSPANLEADIPAVRDECDILVVSIHAGMEFVEEVHPSVAEAARLAVDLGADCVVGHHPHVPQPVEVYRGKPVFYSLGNFLFDNRAGASECTVQWERRHKGLLAVVAFEKGAAPSFEIFGTEYDAGELRVGLSAAAPSTPAASGLRSDDADRAGLGRIARREAATIMRLTRRHGPAFLLSLASDVRPRHLRMLWNALVKRGGAQR
jgi:poly-gamma-glutamate capsule biosynthesis protein CapA/YwtB (metallophosphatase superfamily)